jgi:membrane protein implicated in regulation of membrane protease activity
MDAWIWFGFGVALFVFELFVSTGFYLFILGTACLVVGAAALSGLVPGWMLQAALFSVSAFVLWYFFAERFQTLLRSKEKEYTGMIGQTAIARESIVSGAKGGGEMWGAPWRLENVGGGILNAGDECEVLSSDGLVLKVKKKG